MMRMLYLNFIRLITFSKVMKKKKDLKSENFAMKAELIANGGVLGGKSELPDEIENQFLKNIIAFERAPYVKTKTLIPEFSSEAELNDEDLEKEFERLIGELAARHIQYGLCKKLPIRIAYKYLTEEYLNGEVKLLEGGGNIFIDGCSGACPSCFQVDYCDSVAEIWDKDELEKERRKAGNI